MHHQRMRHQIPCCFRGGCVQTCQSTIVCLCFHSQIHDFRLPMKLWLALQYFVPAATQQELLEINETSSRIIALIRLIKERSEICCSQCEVLFTTRNSIISMSEEGVLGKSFWWFCMPYDEHVFLNSFRNIRKSPRIHS